jgi:hypothetical protein
MTVTVRDPFRMDGVVRSHDSIAEVSPEGERLVTIPRGDVLHLRVGSGYMTERMSVLLVLGAALIGGGLFWFYGLAAAVLDGAAKLPKTAAAGFSWPCSAPSSCGTHCVAAPSSS